MTYQQVGEKLNSSSDHEVEVSVARQIGNGEGDAVVGQRHGKPAYIHIVVVPSVQEVLRSRAP